MSKEQLKRLDGFKPLVGNTPLLKIDYTFKGSPRTVYAKAEYYNPSGSIKDRMAYHIFRQAYESGELKAGDTIVEATSGNAGIAFSSLGRCLGHPVRIYMPNWMSIERIKLMAGYGAEIRLVTPEEGGFTGSIAMAENAAKTEPNIFLPRQFENEHNWRAHYTTTGPEIDAQMASIGVTPTAFVAGVGTGGTIMGVGRYFKEKYKGFKAHPMEPANSPTLRTGYKVGKHRIQGISDEFIPDIVKLKEIDDIVSVDDGDAILMAQKLAKSLGIAVGISSGANMIAAIMLNNECPDKIIATVFPDDNKKYLSTDYANVEPIKGGSLSPDIELIRITTIK